MRKRLWFVAFSNPLSTLNYEWPLPEKRTWKLKDILEEKVEPKYYLTKKHELYLEKNDKTNKDKGYWFSSIVLDPEKESKSISFGGQGWDRNIIYDEINAPESLPNNKEINSKKLRRLTTRELLRLQGFPEEFAIPSIWTISWSFMGMATNVNVAERIGKSVLKAIDEKTIEKSAKILINSGINF
jgi:DNA (cytosine-5)-methyltransferase 1